MLLGLKRGVNNSVGDNGILEPIPGQDTFGAFVYLLDNDKELRKRADELERVRLDAIEAQKDADAQIVQAALSVEHADDIIAKAEKSDERAEKSRKAANAERAVLRDEIKVLDVKRAEIATAARSLVIREENTINK